MPEYRAKPGQEDRHGEMTGAISVNMVLAMLPVTIFSVFIAPNIFENMWLIAGSSVLLAIVLSLAFFPVSRWVWAHLSAFMDGDLFNRHGHGQ